MELPAVESVRHAKDTRDEGGHQATDPTSHAPAMETIEPGQRATESGEWKRTCKFLTNPSDLDRCGISTNCAICRNINKLMEQQLVQLSNIYNHEKAIPIKTHDEKEKAHNEAINLLESSIREQVASILQSTLRLETLKSNLELKVSSLQTQITAQSSQHETELDQKDEIITALQAQLTILRAPKRSPHEQELDRLQDEYNTLKTELDEKNAEWKEKSRTLEEQKRVKQELVNALAVKREKNRIEQISDYL